MQPRIVWNDEGLEKRLSLWTYLWEKIKEALYEPKEVGVCMLAYEPFVRRYEFKVLAHKFVGVIDRERVLVGEAGLAVKCDVEYEERDLAVVAR